MYSSPAAASLPARPPEHRLPGSCGNACVRATCSDARLGVCRSTSRGARPGLTWQVVMPLMFHFPRLAANAQTDGNSLFPELPLSQEGRLQHQYFFLALITVSSLVIVSAQLSTTSSGKPSPLGPILPFWFPWAYRVSLHKHLRWL